MKLINIYESVLNENPSTMTLYHGTCEANANRLVRNGWKPNSGNGGGNVGQPKYLYLSSGREDALWYAEENGCDIVVTVGNIPINSLKPDPEDEAGFTMHDLLKSLNKTPSLPRKFVLVHPLPAEHFTFDV